MLRGVTAVKTPSVPLPVDTSAIVPCYIGMAPYWQTGADWDEKAGQSFACSSFEEFKALLGYYEPASGAWPMFASLCEAAAAHFRYAREPVGPIICVVNALALDTEEADAATLNFSGGTATVNVAGLAVLSTAEITGKTKGTDYTVAYDETGQKLVFTDLTGAMESETATYDVVVIPDPLTMAETTLDALDTMEQDIRRHPAVIAAPGWEAAAIGDGTVGARLQAVANGRVGGHWYVQAYIQLASAVYSGVAPDKTSAGYTSAQVRACWPYASKGGFVYSLVTVLLAVKMRTDIARGDIPYESPSNKDAGIDYPCAADGTKIKLTETQADALNAVGVTTLKWVAGAWRTWGNRMANYSEAGAADIPPEQYNDVTVQMLDFICNDFQERNIELIDAPMSVRTARAIVDDYQVILNGYNAIEASLYGQIYLDPTENTTRQLIAGDLTYGIKVTPTPPVNSISGEVQYTAEGFAAFGQGGEE